MNQKKDLRTSKTFNGEYAKKLLDKGQILTITFMSQKQVASVINIRGGINGTYLFNEQTIGVQPVEEVWDQSEVRLNIDEMRWMFDHFDKVILECKTSYSKDQEYTIPSGLGGVFSLKYKGYENGVYKFKITNKGFERDVTYTAKTVGKISSSN